MRTSGIIRLAGMEQLLTVQDVKDAFPGAVDGAVKGYLKRWCDKGWVRALGPRANVYMNLQVDEPIPQEHLYGLAVKRILKEDPVVIGAEALYKAGWITQIPQKLDIAVPFRRSYPGLYHADIHQRNDEWLKHASRSQSINPVLSSGMRVLSAPFALADALLHGDKGGIWRPYPDDLYLPDTIGPKKDFIRAVGLLSGQKISFEESDDFEDVYERLYEVVEPLVPIRKNSKKPDINLNSI